MSESLSTSGFQLKSTTFRKEREAAWAELEALLQKADKQGIRGLDAGDLYRLPVLYRGVLSSLSVARSISLDKNVIAYLESLASRAYVRVYGGPGGFWSRLAEFFSDTFPRRVWEMRHAVLLSIVLMLLGIACGFVLTLQNEERYYSLVPDTMAQGRSPLTSRADLLSILKDEDETPIEALTVFASMLFTHNAAIGLGCFVLGFAAGVPVSLLVIYNGLLLGAMAAVYHQKGLSVEFWAWILPHGVTELLAVCLCAAAGLMIGRSLIFPGRYSRLHNLARQGREAASVVAGVVALFFVAALIEGFFRQMVLDEFWRYLVVGLTSLWWLYYFRPPGPSLAQRVGVESEGRRS